MTENILVERDSMVGVVLQTVCFATAEAVEGRAAFKAKRPPASGRR